MTEAVPIAVVEALSGYPEVGVADVMIPLLTVDADGYPHVCLLSRAELDADLAHVFAVVTSPTTRANILRDRRATLVVFTESAACYCKLDVTFVDDDDGVLRTAFAVASTKVDGDESFAMAPPRYLATDAIAASENWARSRLLLKKLRASLSDGR